MLSEADEVEFSRVPLCDGQSITSRHPQPLSLFCYKLRNTEPETRFLNSVRSKLAMAVNHWLSPPQSLPL